MINRPEKLDHLLDEGASSFTAHVDCYHSCERQESFYCVHR